MFYEQIFKKFNQHKIKYVVVGGLAVNLHGIPRMTADLDLLVEIEDKNLFKIIKCMRGMGYRPRLPVKAEELLDENNRRQWISKRNLKVFTFVHGRKIGQELDILLVSPVKFEDVYKNRVVKSAGHLKIPIVSVPDLIKMKQRTGRQVDIFDVGMLKLLLK